MVRLFSYRSLSFQFTQAGLVRRQLSAMRGVSRLADRKRTLLSRINKVSTIRTIPCRTVCVCGQHFPDGCKRDAHLVACSVPYQAFQRPSGIAGHPIIVGAIVWPGRMNPGMRIRSGEETVRSRHAVPVESCQYLFQRFPAQSSFRQRICHDSERPHTTY